MTAKESVLITGASGGIGQALAAAFSRAAYGVVGIDRAPPPPASNFVHLDVDLDRLCTDAGYRQQSLAQIRAALGGRRLRALINNAAHQVVRPLAQLTPEDWSASLNVNLSAPWLLTQALMVELEQAHGCVINVASIHARLTKPGFVAYATAKAGLVGLTRSMAVELGDRVRVNAICPGAVDTPMLAAGLPIDARRDLAVHHPVGRIGTPEEIANLALYLCSAAPAFLTGTAIDIDGGVGSRLHDPC